MKQKHKSMDDLHLPLEICIEILTRAPVKSILRFRSVCKSWYSLISCPDFKPKTLSDRILLDCQEPGARSLTSHDLSFSESRDIGEDLPDGFRGRGLHPIGSCHGLICLYNYRYDDRSKLGYISSFFIYNPAIRKTVEVPSLNLSGKYCPRYYGFGFDSKTGDYKVMLISSDESNSEDEDENEGEKIHVGFMFDLRNGVWREFTPIFSIYWRPMYRSPKFYLNDAIHWDGLSYEHKFVLSFNVSDETFREVSMPEELNRGYYYSVITTHRGVIHAMAEDGGEMSTRRFSVWVMKEYGVAESWTKVFAVDMPPRFWPYYSCILFFWIRGPGVAEVLMRHCPPRETGDQRIVEYIDRHLILHNNESGESQCLFSTEKEIEGLVFYEESLVLM